MLTRKDSIRVLRAGIAELKGNLPENLTGLSMVVVYLTIVDHCVVQGEATVPLEQVVTESGEIHATVSRLCSTLAQYGHRNTPGLRWIEIEEVPANRRYKQIRLTKLGREVAGKVIDRLSKEMEIGNPA